MPLHNHLNPSNTKTRNTKNDCILRKTYHITLFFRQEHGGNDDYMTRGYCNGSSGRSIFRWNTCIMTNSGYVFLKVEKIFEKSQ